MQKYELTISANIRQVEPYYGSAGLEIRDTVMIQAEGFLGVCQVLAQFHELGQRLRAAKEEGGQS